MSRSERIVAAISVLVDGPPPPPISVIPLSRAHVCVEAGCSAVFDLGEARACPVCGSESVEVERPGVRPGKVIEFRRFLAQRGREEMERRLAARERAS